MIKKQIIEFSYNLSWEDKKHKLYLTILLLNVYAKRAISIGIHRNSADLRPEKTQKLRHIEVLNLLIL